MIRTIIIYVLAVVEGAVFATTCLRPVARALAAMVTGGA